MIFRILHETKGGHVHCRLFAGPHEGALGKCGELTMRANEFASFADACPMIDYVPDIPKGNSDGAKRIGRQIAERVALTLIEDQRADLERAIADAVQLSFDMGVRSAGGEVLNLRADFDNVDVPRGARATPAAAAADWFTLPPNLRTKKKLLEMLGGIE